MVSLVPHDMPQSLTHFGLLSVAWMCHVLFSSGSLFRILVHIINTALSDLSESHSVVSDSLRPAGPYSSWNSPDQNTGVGSLLLLQGIILISKFSSYTTLFIKFHMNHPLVISVLVPIMWPVHVKKILCSIHWPSGQIGLEGPLHRVGQGCVCVLWLSTLPKWAN